MPCALYQDGVKKAGQAAITTAFERIPRLQLCPAEVAQLDPTGTATLQYLLAASERAFATLKRRLPLARFPHTRQYVLRLINEGLAYLRHLLATGQPIPLSTIRLENIWSRVLLRIKQLGHRWSAPGALHMLAACLVHALHPERYAEVEAAVRGEHRPQISILITTLDAACAS